MQTIEVTDEQYLFVTRLREAIAEELVGRYGHVRERDAIQYLIDNLDSDVELPEEVTADPTAEEPSGDEEISTVSYEESDSSADPDRPDEGSATESETDEPDTVDGGESGDGGESEDATVEDEDEESDAGDGTETESSGTADDDDMLNEMMNLLDTHADKWEESSSADYRYSVELPDGTTEDVQTKDDVRALLFKHYR